MKRKLADLGKMVEFYLERLESIGLDLVRDELFKRLSDTELADADFDGHFPNTRHAQKLFICRIFDDGSCLIAELGTAIYKPKETVRIH